MHLSRKMHELGRSPFLATMGTAAEGGQAGSTTRATGDRTILYRRYLPDPLLLRYPRMDINKGVGEMAVGEPGVGGEGIIEPWWEKKLSMGGVMFGEVGSSLLVDHQQGDGRQLGLLADTWNIVANGKIECRSQ